MSGNFKVCPNRSQRLKRARPPSLLRDADSLNETSQTKIVKTTDIVKEICFDLSHPPKLSPEHEQVESEPTDIIKESEYQNGTFLNVYNAYTFCKKLVKKEDGTMEEVYTLQKRSAEETEGVIRKIAGKSPAAETAELRAEKHNLAATCNGNTLEEMTGLVVKPTQFPDNELSITRIIVPAQGAAQKDKLPIQSSALGRTLPRVTLSVRGTIQPEKVSLQSPASGRTVQRVTLSALGTVQPEKVPLQSPVLGQSLPSVTLSALGTVQPEKVPLQSPVLGQSVPRVTLSAPRTVQPDISFTTVPVVRTLRSAEVKTYSNHSKLDPYVVNVQTGNSTASEIIKAVKERKLVDLYHSYCNLKFSPAMKADSKKSIPVTLRMAPNALDLAPLEADEGFEDPKKDGAEIGHISSQPGNEGSSTENQPAKEDIPIEQSVNPPMVRFVPVPKLHRLPNGVKKFIKFTNSQLSPKKCKQTTTESAKSAPAKPNPTPIQPAKPPRNSLPAPIKVKSLDSMLAKPSVLPDKPQLAPTNTKPAPTQPEEPVFLLDSPQIAPIQPAKPALVPTKSQTPPIPIKDVQSMLATIQPAPTQPAKPVLIPSSTQPAPIRLNSVQSEPVLIQPAKPVVISVKSQRAPPQVKTLLTKTQPAPFQPLPLITRITTQPVPIQPAKSPALPATTQPAFIQAVVPQLISTNKQKDSIQSDPLPPHSADIQFVPTNTQPDPIQPVNPQLIPTDTQSARIQPANLVLFPPSTEPSGSQPTQSQLIRAMRLPESDDNKPAIAQPAKEILSAKLDDEKPIQGQPNTSAGEKNCYLINFQPESRARLTVESEIMVVEPFHTVNKNKGSPAEAVAEVCEPKQSITADEHFFTYIAKKCDKLPLKGKQAVFAATMQALYEQEQKYNII